MSIHLKLATDTERELLELAFRLLGNMTRAELAQVQKRIAPLLQMDIVFVSISDCHGL